MWLLDLVARDTRDSIGGGSSGQSSNQCQDCPVVATDTVMVWDIVQSAKFSGLVCGTPRESGSP